MKLNYKYGESNTKPNLIDDTSSLYITYIYKNIKEIERDGTIMYTYEVAELTKDKYKQYLEELEFKKYYDTVNTLSSLSDDSADIQINFDTENDNETISIADKIKLLVNSISVSLPDGTEKKNKKIKFPKKLGYKWKPYYDGSKFSFEMVEDPNFEGSDKKPILFKPRMEVYEFYFYTDGKKTYICIKNGNPDSINDKEYFEKL